MKKSHILNILGAIIVLSAVFLYEHLRHKKLEESHKYTIGVVYRDKNLPRGGVEILYRFTYEGKAYQGGRPVDLPENKRKLLIDKRFLVKFNPDNPNLNSIDLSMMVKDSLMKAPTDGWTEIPKMK